MPKVLSLSSLLPPRFSPPTDPCSKITPPRSTLPAPRPPTPARAALRASAAEPGADAAGANYCRPNGLQTLLLAPRCRQPPLKKLLTDYRQATEWRLCRTDADRPAVPPNPLTPARAADETSAAGPEAGMTGADTARPSDPSVLDLQPRQGRARRKAKASRTTAALSRISARLRSAECYN